ncbi:sugar ABC transporter substrate-binding protein [Terrabacter sp. MAHUQ-38]|uniref:ABC transporter substrate-binding protein n=1 Tax=unclassified Terrabacter TaxID=2630222 RepID=UPI00165D8204|nr:sugar ABC transporter substrate-binding protein [Terrabacter sp. MAHUQ-38]MBC9823943.1 sugar ABC transporter substrate-binding protein [Terrabacter sp. MAHUQ-38]
MDSSARFSPSRRAVLSGALGLGATAALSSCSASSGSDSKALTVAYFGDPKSAASLSKVADPFRKANPGVTVRFVGTTGTDWNEFFTKLLAQIAAGNPPDIVSVATEGVQLFASKKLAEPLDEYVKRDKSELQSYFSDVHPSLVEAMMYEGSLYELPTDFNCGNMYFNSKLLKQARVDYPAADWTMDDFHGIAKKISTAAPDVVAFNWVVRLWGSWTSFMYANGGNLLTEGKYSGGDWLWDTFYANDPAAKGRGGGFQWGAPTANSDAVVESLEYMLQLKREALAPQPDAGGGGTLQGLFTNNKIGMSIGGGFWAGGLHNAGMGMNDFDVQLFPKWKTQRHLFGTGGFGMLRSSKNKELAWELMKSMSSVEGINVLTAGNVTTPARRSMMTADRYASTGPKHWQVFYDTLTKLPDTAPIPAPPYYNQMATALVSRTTQALSSGNVRSALDGLQGDLEGAANAVT